MRLFLLRHAHARDTWPDETRHLSARGLNQIKKLFSTLDKSMFSDVVQIWYSPYLRARQTAEEFKRIASIGAPLVENAFLRPADSAENTAKDIAMLSSFGGDLMIVGHNPHLEQLSDILLGSGSDCGKTMFHKCTLAMYILSEAPGVSSPYGRWTLSFLISPCVLNAEDFDS